MRYEVGKLQFVGRDSIDSRLPDRLFERAPRTLLVGHRGSRGKSYSRIPLLQRVEYALPYLLRTDPLPQGLYSIALVDSAWR